MDPTYPGNDLTMLVVDQANKSLHEAGIVCRIVMTATRGAEIVARGNTRIDAGARMADWTFKP